MKNNNKLFLLINDYFVKPQETPNANDDNKNNTTTEDSGKNDIDKLIVTINNKYEQFKKQSYFETMRQNNYNNRRNEEIKDPNLYNDFETKKETINCVNVDPTIKQDDTPPKKLIRKNIKKCCESSDDVMFISFRRNMRRLENSLEDIIVSINEKIDKQISKQNPTQTLKNINDEVNLIIKPIDRVIRKNENDNNVEKLGTERIFKNKVLIETKVNSISDLLEIINTHVYDAETQYNINLEALYNIKEPLIELNSLIGMGQLKENIVDQILYFIQNLHLDSTNKKSNDFLHTVIYGPPGTGKTEVAKIMGQIYCKLGILKKGNFRKVTRSDLVAGYLGQTAMKTADVIKESLDGVLFIDEAYSLGNPEKRDSFAKECIDTLCEGLSDHKDRLMVIIAGYESELKDCFFSYNQGLESRFSWRFKIDDYKGDELYKIFLKKVADLGWKIHETDEDTKKKMNNDWFNKNLVYFKYFGRDIETLLSKVKICHSRRVFGMAEEEKRKVTFNDLEKGFQLFCSSEEVKKRKDNEDMKFRLSSLYI